MLTGFDKDKARQAEKEYKTRILYSV